MTIESMKKSAQKGFTLIELMIVIAIIGILASIAIPEFAAFRTKAFNSAAMSDVKNGVTVIEGSFSTSYAYPTIGTAVVATATTTLGGDNWTPSDGVTVGTGVGTATTYKLCAKHLTGDTIYTKTNATKNVAGVKTAASEGTALLATDCT